MEIIYLNMELMDLLESKARNYISNPFTVAVRKGSFEGKAGEWIVPAPIIPKPSSQHIILQR